MVQTVNFQYVPNLFTTFMRTDMKASAVQRACSSPLPEEVKQPPPHLIFDILPAGSYNNAEKRDMIE